jgi:pilus assembly protein TadC
MPDTSAGWLLWLIAFVSVTTLCFLALERQRTRAWSRAYDALREGAGAERAAATASLRERLFGKRLRTGRVRHEIDRNLANILDLMRVCIDAGLDLHSTMARISEEFSGTSPELSRLFHIVQLQLKAGASREQAFDAFAEASGSPEVRNLMVSLAEAERFGAGVSTILRTYSTELRTRKRLHAEELGAKLPTKLLFPLLLCLFPAMLVVLAGPSILSALEIARGMR